MSHLIAMGLTGRRAIEACGEDALFQHEHTAHKSAVAGAAF
jgi:hypothetical protein